jgi:hypothetical protein
LVHSINVLNVVPAGMTGTAVSVGLDPEAALVDEGASNVADVATGLALVIWEIAADVADAVSESTSIVLETTTMSDEVFAGPSGRVVAVETGLECLVVT